MRFNPFRKQRRSDEDFANEIASHLQLEADDLQSEGHSESEAKRRARIAFSNPTRAQERFRLRNRIQWLENLRRDLHFSLRQLRRSPGFTATAVLTLALGLGANTAIFSLVNGLLFRPLSVPHGEQLILLRIDMGGPEPQYYFTEPLFRSLERKDAAFEDVFAFDQENLQVRGLSHNEDIAGQLVSGQFFRALQVPPLLGRTLTPDDDRTGGNSDGFALVLSEHFWKRWFNGATDVIGSKLRVDNTIFTVVGVMPKRFIGADIARRPEIYLPLSAEPIINPMQSRVRSRQQGMVANLDRRIKPGVSLTQANAALQIASMPVVDEVIKEAGVPLSKEEESHLHFVAEPGGRGYAFIRSVFQKPLTAVLAMCAGVLLLACLNLASLLLVRGTARKRELAAKLALGSSRSRLIQQLLMESLLLILSGTAVGLALAPLVSQSLAQMLLKEVYSVGIYIDTSLDLNVLAFAGIGIIVATLLVGLVPALVVTSGDLVDKLKKGQLSAKPLGLRQLLPKMILASEVALALALLIGAGLLSSSLVRLYRSGSGFDPRGVVDIALEMDKQPLKGDALVRLYKQIAEGLGHQPGVKSVSFNMIVPFTGIVFQHLFSTSNGTQPSIIKIDSVAPDYFQTMNIPVLEGREFNWEDTRATGLKVILNRSAAKLLFKGQSPLRQYVLSTRNKTSREVVGVVGDAKYIDLRTPAPPTVYYPMSLSQGDDQKFSYHVVVRYGGPLAPLVNTVRSLLSRLAPEIPTPEITTMDSIVDNALATERLMSLLSTFFAACALLVTAIGLYGTLAYATARRTSEIGIRIALGAQRKQVVFLVLRENTWSTAIGSVAGLIVALLATRALSSFLYGTSTREPWILVASVTGLVIIASSASLLPAIRAARVDPSQALRSE